MKDFVKLTKETWRFYLASLCIALLPVISNNIYVLRQLKPKDSSEQALYAMAEIFWDKADAYDLINFWVALLGMALLLFVRHFSFVDRRTMEFQMFMPVKKRMAAIHDYICSLGVIVIPWLVTICTFAIAQARHNSALIATDQAWKEEAQIAGMELWKVGLCYLLYLVCAFTILYLGIVICKNGIVGMAVMAAVWSIAYFLEVYESSGSLLGYLLTPEFFLRDLYHKPAGMTGLANLFGVTVFMILLIIIAAEKRELSRGKWFYFPFLDYLFPVVCGVFTANICCRVFWVEDPAAILVGAIICGVLWFLLQRDQRIKSDRWEVK